MTNNPITAQEVADATGQDVEEVKQVWQRIAEDQREIKENNERV